MARDRQRSKARQRQQQRRDERLAQRRDSGTAQPKSREPRPDPAPLDPELEQELLEQADLEVGAPPEDLGRGDHTLRDEPPPPDFDTDDETLFEDTAGDGSGDGRDGGGTAVATGPRGHRGRAEGADTHKRGRLVAFLVAVWAELQRVQWPDRKQLTQLTGVVLFFVLIVGAYLGGLDAIFSKLIQEIL
jgi:preprotein translocase subunit SecE